jgi:hypothetical protein
MKVIKNLFNKSDSVLEEKLKDALKKLKSIREIVGYPTSNSVEDVAIVDAFLNFYESFDKDIRNNKIFIRALIKEEPFTYRPLMDKFANKKISSEFLQEMSLYAVQQNPYVIKNVPYNSQTKEIALIAVSKSGDSLYFLKPIFRKDKDVVDVAISNSGRSIQYTTLQNQKDIFLKAVTKTGSALEFANSEQLEDWDILSTAYLSDPSSINFLNDEWKENPERLISLNFTGFIELFAQKSPTEAMEKIHTNLLSHKNKELALKAEKELCSETSLKYFFEQCCENGTEAFYETTTILNAYLENMLPFWQKSSIETFLNFVEKSAKNDEENKEAFNLLVLTAKKYVNNKQIQEVTIKDKINIKKKRKIKF